MRAWSRAPNLFVWFVVVIEHIGAAAGEGAFPFFVFRGLWGSGISCMLDGSGGSVRPEDTEEEAFHETEYP